MLRWLSLVGTLLGACSQSTISLRFHRVTVPVASGSTQYYASVSSASASKALVYLEGTSRMPATHNFGIGAEATLFGYSVVYPERMYLEWPEAFSHAECREQRMLETLAVLRDLEAKGIHKFLFVAQSEGTMIAPEIAQRLGDKTAGLVCIAGTLNTFRHDLVFSAQTHHPSFPWSEVQFSQSLTSIDGHPDDRNTMFWGHSYHFGSSYLDVSAPTALAGAKYPIIYLNGLLDEADFVSHRAAVQTLQRLGVDVESIEYSGIGHQMGREFRPQKKDLLDWVKRKNL